MDESESIGDESNESCFFCFQLLFLVSHFIIIYLLSFISFDKSDFIDYESDDDGSESGSAGMCAFPFRFDEYVGRVVDSVGLVDYSVGRVCGVGSGIFVQKGIESIGDIFLLVVSLPKGVDSKVSQLIDIFWVPKSGSSLLVSKYFL